MRKTMWRSWISHVVFCVLSLTCVVVGQTGVAPWIMAFVASALMGAVGARLKIARSHLVSFVVCLAGYATALEITGWSTSAEVAADFAFFGLVLLVVWEFVRTTCANRSTRSYSARSAAEVKCLNIALNVDSSSSKSL